MTCYFSFKKKHSRVLEYDLNGGGGGGLRSEKKFQSLSLPLPAFSKTQDFEVL